MVGTLEASADGGVEAEVGEGARGEVPLLVVFLGLRLRIPRRRRRRRPAELPLGRHGEVADKRREEERGLFPPS